MAHPTLFAVLVAAGLITILQLVETVIVGRDASTYSGIDALAAVPVVAVIALVTAVRAREKRWAADMAAVLAFTLGAALLTLFGDTVYLRADEGLVGTVLWRDYAAPMEGHDGGLLLRLAVSAPPMLWFALFGPARPLRWRAWRGLQVTVVVALAVSLTAHLDGRNQDRRSDDHLLRPPRHPHHQTVAVRR